MITFRHGVNNFKNMVLECSGESFMVISAASTALMQGAISAIKKRNPKRLDVTDDGEIIRVKCEYNQHTAEIAMTAICGFEWLAKQCSDVKVERISERKMKENGETP